jgi:hypothetical protein
MEEEKGAPSMYQITKIWHEGKDKETWTNIYTEYMESMRNSSDYSFFIDYLKEYYEAPKKK